jgi:DNA-binding beta-propeller fold protein YncE
LSPAGATLGTFLVGADPLGIAFDGTNMWVGNSDAATVTELSPLGATLGTFSVGDVPLGLAFDGASMWVVNGADSTV